MEEMLPRLREHSAAINADRALKGLKPGPAWDVAAKGGARFPEPGPLTRTATDGVYPWTFALWHMLSGNQVTGRDLILVTRRSKRGAQAAAEARLEGAWIDAILVDTGGLLRAVRGRDWGYFEERMEADLSMRWGVPTSPTPLVATMDSPGSPGPQWDVRNSFVVDYCRIATSRGVPLFECVPHGSVVFVARSRLATLTKFLDGLGQGREVVDDALLQDLVFGWYPELTAGEARSLIASNVVVPPIEGSLGALLGVAVREGRVLAFALDSPAPAALRPTLKPETGERGRRGVDPRGGG
jgi:hypothetical protein